MFLLKFYFRLLILAALVSPKVLAAKQRDSDSLIGAERVPFSIYFADYFSGVSYSNISFRDFATSPLFYRGPALDLSMGWPVVQENSYREFGMNALFGLPSAVVPENSQFEVKSPGRFFFGNLNYSYLRKTNLLHSHALVYLGLTAASRFHFRINRALGNNGTGVEAFFNFMASGRLEKDFSRKSGEGKSWLLFKRKNDVFRTLAYQLNVGLINFNYRPGYAYGGFSEFDGSNTNGLQFLLDGHFWSLNGIRVQSRVEWIINKKKKYSNRWIYSWELITAPGKFEKFQFVSHTFTYSMLLFKK